MISYISGHFLLSGSTALQQSSLDANAVTSDNLYTNQPSYTLSHLENDRDVSAYSGGRRLTSRAQLVCFLTRLKRNTGIDA